MGRHHGPSFTERAGRSTETGFNRRQRVIGGLALSAAGAVGLLLLNDKVGDIKHEHAVYDMFSDPSVSKRVQSGEIDPNSVVPITAVPGDTAEGIANRLGDTYDDRRNLADELSSQAGDDGIQPGEVLYAPAEQINIYRAD